MENIPEQKAFRFSLIELKKVLKSAAIAAGAIGAVLFLGTTDAIDADLYTALWTAVAAWTINLVKVWIEGKV